NGSCIGQLACRMAGSGAAFSVGDGSCDGGRSCDSSGVKSGDGDAGFEAGDGSCVGGGACGAAGSTTGAGNAGFKAGDGSCLGIGACDAAGTTISASNGRFEAENDSCVGDMACQTAGFDPGGGAASFSIGNFSCNTDGNFTECQAEIANIGDCEFNDPPGPQECMPDVGVGLSCEPAEVAQGSDLTCRIDVLNQSFGQAPNATMSTATPPGTTFVALTVPPAWTCPVLPAVGGTGAIECD